jgi:ribonuclease Z
MPSSSLLFTHAAGSAVRRCRYYDAEIRTLLARHTRKRSNSGIDLRAGVMPQPLPPPGDPRRTGLRVADLTWSLRMDHEWVVRVAPLRNRQPTFGYMLLEGDRCAQPALSSTFGMLAKSQQQICSFPLSHLLSTIGCRYVQNSLLCHPEANCFVLLSLCALRSGRLDASRAIELGVEPGPNFTSLKLGESVELPDGRVVHSADVLGPVRRGR